MRNSHPNLFLGMLACGGFSLANGLTMILTAPRLPALMPHTPVGMVFLVAAFLMLMSAFVDSWFDMGKVGLILLMVLTASLGAGLVYGYTVGITASLDRSVTYIFISLYCLAPLREPGRNPLTSKQEEK